MADPKGIIVTSEQLRMYAEYLQPAMVVIAPIVTTPPGETKCSIGKEFNRECVILSTYPHFARVQGLNGEGIFCVKYIDLYTRNPVPRDIQTAPQFKAPRREEVISEEDLAD